MTNDLNIQTPGQSGPTENSALEKALDTTVQDFAAGLDEYSDDDLVTLNQLEAGKENGGRKGITQAIELEQKRRLKERDEQAQDDQNDASALPEDPSYKDPETAYRHLSAEQVDATKITVRVLTKDGWVMPRPAASPVG